MYVLNYDDKEALKDQAYALFDIYTPEADQAFDAAINFLCDNLPTEEFVDFCDRF